MHPTHRDDTAKKVYQILKEGREYFGQQPQHEQRWMRRMRAHDYFISRHTANHSAGAPLFFMDFQIDSQEIGVSSKPKAKKVTAFVEPAVRRCLNVLI